MPAIARIQIGVGSLNKISIGIFLQNPESIFNFQTPSLVPTHKFRLVSQYNAQIDTVFTLPLSCKKCNRNCFVASLYEVNVPSLFPNQSEPLLSLMAQRTVFLL